MPARDAIDLPPSGCTHCGLPRHLHFHRWTDAAGWHVWEHPTPAQIKTRMLDRRRRGVIAREYPPIPWDDPQEGAAMHWTPDTEVRPL